MGFDNVNVNVSGPVQPTSTYKTKVLKGNHSFVSQVTEPNMKYVIKHDFDLGGGSVTIPANCILEFDGGSLSNGIVDIALGYVINLPLSSYGCVYNYLEPKKDYINLIWFYNNTDTDYTNAMSRAIEVAHNSDRTIFIPNGSYQIVGCQIPYDNIVIKGESRNNCVVFNNTWGTPCFVSENDNIEISDIFFSATPHTSAIKTTTPDDDNGRSAILAKGENCTFHDLTGDEIQAIVFLGGDFLDAGITKKGNVCYNIECRKIQWGVCALQQENLIIHDVFGTYYTFSNTDYESGANPGHLVYLSGNATKFHKNVSVYNVQCFEGKAGSAISIKAAINGHIKNIYSINSALGGIGGKNVVAENLTCINNNTYRHAFDVGDATGMNSPQERQLPSCNFNTIVKNLFINGGYSVIRCADYGIMKLENCTVIADETTLIGGAASYIGIDSNCYAEISDLRVSSVNSSPYYSLTFAGAGTINDYLLTREENEALMYLSNNVTAVNGQPNSLNNYIPTANSFVDAKYTESGDRLSFIETAETFLRIDSDKGKMIMLQGLIWGRGVSYRVISITNSSANAINVRCPDKPASIVATSNVDISSISLPAGKAITYYVIKNGNNISINVVSPALSSGATRPTLSFNDVGFQFFDTSLNPQRPIWYKGNNVWVDATGTPV